MKLCYTGLAEPSSIAKHEDNLFKDLFHGYERWVRPVEHPSDKIRIKFGLAISQLVDVVGVHVITYSFLHSFVVKIALWKLSIRELDMLCFPELIFPVLGPHSHFCP